MDNMEYISLNDQFPAPGAETPVAPRERSWGDAAEDVVGNVLSALARGGKGVAALSAGLEAGLNTESFQRQQRALDRAERMAELQLESLENDNQTKRQKNALFPLEKADKEIKGKINALELQGMQERQRLRWQEIAVQRSRRFSDAVKSNIGYNTWNIYAQTVFDNSPYLKEMSEIIPVLEAYSRNSEEGDFLLSQTGTGWRREVDKDGNARLISATGDSAFDISPDNIRKTMGTVQQKLKSAIAASQVLGTDSQDLVQFVTKSMIQIPGIDLLYGDNIGEALSAYQNFVSTGGVYTGSDKNGKPVFRNFTKEEKMAHFLSIALQTAIQDGKITQAEMARLTPQVAEVVKKLGGELIVGKDPVSTVVKIAGVPKPLLQFIEDMKRLDKITPAWQGNVRTGIQRAQYEMLRAEKVRLANEKLRREAKGPDGVGDKEETEEISPTANNIYREQYGNAWSALTPEQKKDFEKQQASLLRAAAGVNLVEVVTDPETKEDKIVPINPEKINLADRKNLSAVKDLADKETEILEDKNLSPRNGYWNGVLRFMEESIDKLEENAKAEKMEHARLAFRGQTPRPSQERASMAKYISDSSEAWKRFQTNEKKPKQTKNN